MQQNDRQTEQLNTKCLLDIHVLQILKDNKTFEKFSMLLFAASPML
jgi:hypothetical protein